MNNQEMVRELIRLSKSLDEAQEELQTQVIQEATSDAAYRKARAKAYLASSGTVGEREATVEQATADLRYQAKIAEGLARSALESVRSRRTQLSAFQTLANSIREEAKHTRYGPDAA